eukprot:1889342-Rhodomonas_salina.1
MYAATPQATSGRNVASFSPSPAVVPWVWAWDDGHLHNINAETRPWSSGEPTDPALGRDCVQTTANGWQTADCSSSVPISSCSKAIPDGPCDTSTAWCEQQLADAGLGTARIVTSSCACGCCFYVEEDSNDLNRIGACSPICSSLNFEAQNISVLAPSVFDGLEHVRVLSLAGNSITSLPAGVFQGVSGVSILNLADNKILEVKQESFAGLTAIVELDLRGNNLSAVSPTTFGPLDSLLVLQLRDNQIHSVESGAFATLTSLLVLDMIGNRVRDLAMIDETPSSLRAVYLERNELTVIQGGSLDGLTPVKYLQLGYNRITKLERFSFEAVPGLKKLGLAANSIQMVEFGIL